MINASRLLEAMIESADSDAIDYEAETREYVRREGIAMEEVNKVTTDMESLVAEQDKWRGCTVKTILEGSSKLAKLDLEVQE
jgi:hypothetical protein